jgi:SAM-dependent methyltransferase
MQGNHSLISRIEENLDHLYLDNITLAHFPVRSTDQLVTKSVIGWMAILARNLKWDGASYQWRQNFDAICDGVFPEGERLCEASMRYAQEDKGKIEWTQDATAEIPSISYERTHSSGAFGDPIKLIERTWKRSLTLRSPLLRLSRPEAGQIMDNSVTDTALSGNWQWDNLFVDIPPFRWIAERYHPTSVLDLGCGTGAHLLIMKLFGAAKILGVDGIPAGVTALEADEYRLCNLSEYIDLNDSFDIVICTEVAEHISDTYAENLLHNIDRHAARLIIFSAAAPGQPGAGHINCQPIEVWLQRWQLLGWGPDLRDTLAMRALATFSWFRRNLVVLKRDIDRHLSEGVHLLEKIGQKSFIWYGQNPAIREEIASEDLPQQAGYTGLGLKMVSAIETLNTTAFVVESQTTECDKISLLRIQKLIRAHVANYVYVEVGSHLGGTLAPHLADPRCQMVISIDPRPCEQPDVRGRLFVYEDNSTTRMIEGLERALPAGCLTKLRTFDLDAAEVCPVDIDARADLVMIDGEHTPVAAFSDVMSLLPIIAADAVTSFHDANLVADAIQNLERFFTYASINFATVFLRDNVCAIGLRRMAEHVAAELGPHAHNRGQFLANARRHVLGCIVSEALRRGDVSSRDELDASERARDAIRLDLEEAHRIAHAAREAADNQVKIREALALQLRTLEASTSWRITGPARWLVSKALRR